ncbi:cytochrome C [Myxococcus sp. AM010]|uniref:c-type cytochrome n=1 Tax=Myxococcus sp. AM010 TaxID=2745138 RepID=UPI0015956DE4|nr:cytochrome C [Myxococcus sp. AM010]
MTFRMKLLVGTGAVLSFVGGAALATSPVPPPSKAAAQGAEVKKHELPVSKDGNLVVGLCDGETSMEVKGVKAGQSLTRAQAQHVSGALMEEWLRKNPNAHWDPVPLVAQAPSASETVRPGGVTPESGGSQVKKQIATPIQDGHTYGAFSDRDEAIWAASTEQFVDEGHRVFHDAKAIGGTVGISCDMCHPDASNTHPETYPKYQVQLGRVALLRDMINWCIENPARGKPLADGDPRMRAMEAYIYAKRKGVKLEYGKK